MIPKIIHYCWFGGKEKSPLLQACIKTWKRKGGGEYRLIEWNETNCDLNENAHIKEMYLQNKYAFVSDYFRLKALYEHGGIYLDTDVLVYRSFDPLLDADFFCGFIYDCALGTAVLGATPKNFIVKALLDEYQTDLNGKDIVNNGLFTEYFYKNIPGFRLNGERQSLAGENGERIEIFPKETFETGKVIGRSYTLHFADGSWHPNHKKTSYKKKLLAARLPINLMAFRQQKKARAYMKKTGKYQSWYQEAVKKDL